MKICLAQAPWALPQRLQFMDWLICYGVEQIISTGTCGVLADIEENAFLVPVRALRDEGTTTHYAAPSRYMEMRIRAEVCTKTTDDYKR